MSRDYMNTSAQISVRNRDSRKFGNGNRGRNSGYNIKRNIGTFEGFNLLSASAEHERIAAFKTDNRFALSRLFNKDFVNIFLLFAVSARTLSNADFFSRFGCKTEQ